MNYIHLNDFQVNGFGLLNQPIVAIRDEDLKMSSKTYEDLIEERTHDDDFRPKKLENGKIVEKKLSKYEEFLAEAAELTEGEINKGDKTKYLELKNQINILEKAYYQIETNYNVIYNDFMNGINGDLKEPNTLVKLYWQNAYLNMYNEFVDRVRQKELRKPM